VDLDVQAHGAEWVELAVEGVERNPESERAPSVPDGTFLWVGVWTQDSAVLGYDHAVPDGTQDRARDGWEVVKAAARALLGFPKPQPRRGPWFARRLSYSG